MSYKVQPMAWLPNTHGYRFTGILSDGKTVKCKVVKDDDGCHRVQGIDQTVSYADLKGWKA